MAQQKIDQAKEPASKAALEEAARSAKQAEFKRLDDKLKSWGF